MFSACGPGSLPRSQFIAAVLLSPQPPQPFPPIPPTLGRRTPWSHPLSPGCWGCRRNPCRVRAPGLAASQGPSTGLPEKLPHSFKTLSDPCCRPHLPPRCLRENKGAPEGDPSASCHAPPTPAHLASLVSSLLSRGALPVPCCLPSGLQTLSPPHFQSPANDFLSHQTYSFLLALSAFSDVQIYSRHSTALKDMIDGL